MGSRDASSVSPGDHNGSTGGFHAGTPGTPVQPISHTPEEEKRRQNSVLQPTDIWRQNDQADLAANLNRENQGPLAVNTDLSGCLPTLVRARHGVCVTSEGWLVHWSTLDSDSVWDHMCMDLDIENYTTLYTSKFFNKKQNMTDREKREIIDEILNELGRLHDEMNETEWDIKMVDVNRNYDLLLGFASKETADEINLVGHLTLNTESQGEIIIFYGPVVPHGLINFKRYMVKVSMTPGVP